MKNKKNLSKKEKQMELENKEYKKTLYKEPQYYKGIRLRLIVKSKREYTQLYKAKRYTLGEEKYSQNIWIPNCYLLPNGKLKDNVNIDFIFQKAYIQKKFMYAHIDINPFNF